MIKTQILDKIDSRLEELDLNLRQLKEQVPVGAQYPQGFWEVENRAAELKALREWLVRNPGTSEEA